MVQITGRGHLVMVASGGDGGRGVAMAAALVKLAGVVGALEFGGESRYG